MFIYSAPTVAGLVLGTECAVMGETDNRATCRDDWGGLACWLGEELAVSPQLDAMKGFEEGSTMIQYTCNPPKVHLALVPCLHSINQENRSAAQILPGVLQRTQSPLSPNPLAAGSLVIPCTLSMCPGAPSPLHSFRTPPCVSWSPPVSFASPPPSHLYHTQHLGLSAVLSLMFSFSVPYFETAQQTRGQS